MVLQRDFTPKSQKTPRPTDLLNFGARETLLADKNSILNKHMEMCIVGGRVVARTSGHPPQAGHLHTSGVFSF